MRFRGKAHILFKDGKELDKEYIAIADNRDDAYKKFIIELYGDYKHPATADRVKSFKEISFEEDHVNRPGVEFIKAKLEEYAASPWGRKDIRDKLYGIFRAYNPNWDDDGLSDVLSWSESYNGLETHCKEVEREYHVDDGLEYISNQLLGELDGEWVCHYKPHKSLEAQYQKALAL